MNMSQISSLKSQLEELEKKLTVDKVVYEERESKNAEMETRAKEIMAQQDNIVRLNVGGKKFATTLETLNSARDTLFWSMIYTKKFDLTKEIFFDRNPEMFPYILDYLRYKKLNLKRFTPEELQILADDVEYYQLLDLEKILCVITKEITILKMEVSSFYPNIGSTDFKVLNDKSLQTGVCTNSPGWIIFELDAIHRIKEMQIGGFTGDSGWIYSAGYGSGGGIETSMDKTKWDNVGTIPTGFGQTIVTVPLRETIGKYIKLTSTSWLGLGYLKFK
jgi:hypothetical protein